MITLDKQTELYNAAENWKLIIHPVMFKDLSLKYRSFYKLRNDERYSEDEDAQEAFQPISNIFSKINNSPLPYSNELFEIEDLGSKLLGSSLQNTHNELYKILLDYCDFFLLLQDHDTNPLLTILEQELTNLITEEGNLSNTALLIKRSYLKDVLLEELKRTFKEDDINILTHSELVNSRTAFNHVFSFGPFYDLTPLRESRVLLSPKFSKIHVLSNNISNNIGLQKVSLLSEASGFPLAQTLFLPEPEFNESLEGPELRVPSPVEPTEDLTEEEVIADLIALEKAETEEYLINEGIKKRGERNTEDFLVSAVILHLNDQCSYLVPDENEVKYIESDELDASKGFGKSDVLATISKSKPENISSGDAILIFEGGEGTYTSKLSRKRLGNKYDSIVDSLSLWKDKLNEKIQAHGLPQVSNDLIALELNHAQPHNIRYWSDYELGGPGERQDFGKLLKYLGLQHKFPELWKDLESWRREHQKSGRELSKKITSSIKSHDLINLKEEGKASFEMRDYDGANVTAHLINSCEIVHRIPLSSTKKLIKKH